MRLETGIGRWTSLLNFATALDVETGSGSCEFRLMSQVSYFVSSSHLVFIIRRQGPKGATWR